LSAGAGGADGAGCPGGAGPLPMSLPLMSGAQSLPARPAIMVPIMN